MCVYRCFRNVCEDILPWVENLGGERPHIAQLEPEGPADERRWLSISGRLAKSSAQERLILASSAKKLDNHEHEKAILYRCPTRFASFS